MNNEVKRFNSNIYIYILQNYVNTFNETLMLDMLSDKKVLTDAERLELSMGELIGYKINCKLIL